MFRCIHHTLKPRTFATYSEAHDFVMREGDKSRLWSIECDDQATLNKARETHSRITSFLTKYPPTPWDAED
jgi:hypothetical protein